MPTYKYIITILGGTWNGYSFTKFYKFEVDTLIANIRDVYNVNCKVERIKI